MRKNLSILFFSLTLLCAGRSITFAQDSAIEEYIQKYKGIAEEEMERTGVPAAISLAQGILESQAGKGWLVEHSHNHFGIKCKSGWTGQTILYDDDRKNECFRVYATDDSSWRDHSDFLKQSPRYASLFDLDPLDYKAWARGLKDAGYATSKVYADKLIAYIEKYNLQQYSEKAIAAKGGSTNSFAVMLEKKIQEDRKKSGIPEEKRVVAALPEPKPSRYPQGEFMINNRRVLFLPKGTQLISTADKYHIRLARLLRFNELDSDVLTTDRLIFLQKKSKKGAHATHTVADSESMVQIAAEEGMQLKWLYKWNGLTTASPVKPGEVLYLQAYKPEDGVVSTPAKHRGFFYKLAHLFSGKQKESEYEEVNPSPDPAVSKTQVAVTAPVAHMDTIGSSADTQVVYEVQAGDTLYSISQKYKTSVSQIKQWNALRDDSIKTGQQLIVKK